VNRPLIALRLCAVVLVLAMSLAQVGMAAAQSPPATQGGEGRVQRITARLQPGEIDAYLLRDLRPGNKLTVLMRTVSGDLDPAAGIMNTTPPLEEVIPRYQADLQAALASGSAMAASVEAVRSKYFLAYDDDSGDGYSSALSYPVPKAGDYVLVAGGALSMLGRATSGEYELLIGLDASQRLDAGTQPAGAPIAEPAPFAAGMPVSVQETSGTLTAASPIVNLPLVNMSPGDTLTAYVEVTSGNLRPVLTFRNYGGKPLDTANGDGTQTHAELQYNVTTEAEHYSLEVRAAPLPDGTKSEGAYRFLVGLNSPDVLTGQAQTQGGNVLVAPIEVKTGLKVLRISEVDSPNEKYTVLASLRMDWTDHDLAFSPDTCNCSVKVYTDKDIDRFISEAQSRWPAFTFFNQLGNRWIQSRTAAVWPDGRARYIENFNTTFQADFDFRKFPFDTQTFPIFLDLVFPTSAYTLADLPGYSEIDPAHGEDEFIVSDLTTALSTIQPSGAEKPLSRMTFSFSAPRHLNYYILHIFLPITLIILISWFTFFLRDYSRRIEAAAGNILLFIAFSFSLAGDFPRLGYVTFLGALMAVTLAVNVLVLLYNVYMKRMETEGKAERIERIDNVLDWVYPLLYAGLIAVVAVVYL
jgi:hypothetical protein